MKQKYSMICDGTSTTYLRLEDLPWWPFWYATCGGCKCPRSSKDSMDA